MTEKNVKTQRVKNKPSTLVFLLSLGLGVLLLLLGVFMLVMIIGAFIAGDVDMMGLLFLGGITCIGLSGLAFYGSNRAPGHTEVEDPGSSKTSDSEQG